MFARNRIARAAIALALAAGIAAGSSTPAFADTVGGTSTVSSGSLSFSSSGTPAFNVAIDGTNKSPQATASINVNDDRGSGAGWKVQISASSFTATVNAQTRTLGSITVQSVTSANNGSGTYTAPTNNVSVPVTLGGTASTVFNAAADTGMGHFTITPNFQVEIPANSYAGAYSSTFTVDVTTGPS